MTTTYHGERWKVVEFDFEFTNENRIEISNFGRIRSFNKVSNGNILNGSMINGYPIIRLKFFKQRDEETAKKLVFLQAQVVKLSKKIREMKLNEKPKETIADAEQLLEKVKKNLKKKFADDTKLRTIHYHALIHRLVADYFLPAPKVNQTIVAHNDHDKLNNRANNLKWMTPEDNYAHQQHSPLVIAERLERQTNPLKHPSYSKLTVTRVMLLKKLLNEGKPIKTLVKQFKVTDTQILRIKRGDNWGKIQAAK